jgi:hypothetical protein
MPVEGLVMRWLSAFVLAAVLAAPAVAPACPNCKEAITAAGDEAGDDDPLREARAYNRSVYFMIAVPYSLLGGFGLVSYRLYRSARRRGVVPT